MTNSTLTDVVRINWEIQNGPNAAVSVLDMYTNSNAVILKDFQKDSKNQDWTVTKNPNEAWTCYKVNSQGCDVLTA